MSLFPSDDRFGKGSWAHGLSWLLAPKRFIREWHPRIRVDDETGQKWIQYEPLNWSEAFLASGRPVLRCDPAADVDDQALFVGYCVERWFPPTRAMSNVKAHWAGLERCLATPRLQTGLNALMDGFAAERRVIWILEESPLRGTRIRYCGDASLNELGGALRNAGQQQRISVMLAEMYAKRECLRLGQGDIVKHFGAAIRTSAEIMRLIESAVL